MSRTDFHTDIDLLGLLQDVKSGGRLDPVLRLGGGSGGGATQALDRAGAMTLGDRVAVDILLAEGADGATAQKALEAAGMTGVAVDGRAAGGWIEADAVLALDDVAVVQYARATYAFAQTGVAGAEGSRASNADAARADFGIDGSGVTVGVLSDSFNSRSGANLDRASGDLPLVRVLEDAFGTDEGRAMLQIVHDVAPGADLLFHTANGGQANFAAGVRALADAGADVIVDDIIYLAEPFFQDGLVARAVNSVFESGAAYFSSAGNAGRDSYEAAYLGSGSDLRLQTTDGTVNLGEMHDFDRSAGVDVRQRLVIPEGRDAFISFQWDQPFASVSTGGRASASDMDILLFRAGQPLTLANLVAVSASGNVGGDPVEVFRFLNATSETQFDLVITKFAGPAPTLLKYVELGGARIAEHDTNSGTSYGHAPAAGALGVGAAFFQDTPEFGQDDPILEPFSSAGPSTLLFNEAGGRLPQPKFRSSPDIVGPDGTNNTFFGSDIAGDADTLPNFFGTSAAAPHVAAVAALILEANPELSPLEVYRALTGTAIDMGAPGFDQESGFGYVDARAAVAAAVGPRSSIGTSGNDQLSGAGLNDVILGLAGRDSLHGLAGDDILRGGDGRDVLRGHTGDDVMDGGGGSDKMVGGSGDDIYLVGHGGVVDVVLEAPGLGDDEMHAFGDTVIARNVETLRAATKSLKLYGNAQENIIIGSVGDDLLAGGRGNDLLRGGRGDDEIFGNLGHDLMVGHSGADIMRGGAGDDDIRAGAGDDMLRGDAGDDVLAGGAGQDLMLGGAGDDVYDGFDRGDQIVELAGEGIDTLRTSISMTAPLHVEVIEVVGDVGLKIVGDDLANTFHGGDGGDNLRGGDGGDWLFGHGDDDALVGHSGADVLNGGAGDDLLIGKSGADLLIGGAGDDRFFGGEGRDVFKVMGGGRDRIEDYSPGEDRLDFEGSGFVSRIHLFANATDTAGGVRIETLAGDIVVIAGVQIADLDQDDFSL